MSMKSIEDVKTGQYFTLMGVQYKMLRIAGECTQPNRNQWGRLTGGTYTAHRVAVKVNLGGRRGWRFSYVAVPFGAKVVEGVRL